MVSGKSDLPARQLEVYRQARARVLAENSSAVESAYQEYKRQREDHA